MDVINESVLLRLFSSRLSVLTSENMLCFLNRALWPSRSLTA